MNGDSHWMCLIRNFWMNPYTLALWDLGLRGGLGNTFEFLIRSGEVSTFEGRLLRETRKVSIYVDKLPSSNEAVKYWLDDYLLKKCYDWNIVLKEWRIIYFILYKG